MPVSLSIICNLERVPALDAMGQLAFGMNLAVSWEAKDAQGNPTKPGLPDPPAAGDGRELLPWTWAPIQWIRVQFQPNGRGLGDYHDVPVIDQGMTLISDPLGARLRKAYVDARPQDMPFARKASATQDGQPWPARLLHLSTFPFPIPQSLNLSRLFRVNVTDLGIGPGPNDPKDGTLWAAPIINAGGPFTSDINPVPLDKTNPPPAGNLSPWPYSDPTIAANVTSIGLVPPSDAFVDMKEQWIRVPPSSHYEDDWQAQLEARMAEAFRLPEFFSDLLRVHAADAPDTGLFSLGTNLHQVSTMAVASVADGAGFGLVGASLAKGTSFAERLLATIDKTSVPAVSISPAQWSELESRASQFYGSMQDWNVGLKAALPALSNSELLNGKPLTVPQTLAQFQRILDIVFASDKQQNLWQLFSSQWAALLKQSSIPAGDQAKILAAFAWHASQRLFDIRARLALSNLDRFWPAFVQSNTSADPAGNDLLDNCFPQYLGYYGSVRFGATAPNGTNCTLPGASPAFSPTVAATTDQNLKTELATRLATRADSFKKRLRPDLNVVTTSAAAIPPGITVMLSRLEEDSNGLRPDILTQSSGIVAFMREQGGNGDWHCLNYTEPWLGASKLNTSISDPIVAPYRPHYRGGLKQASLTYNNGCVTADSALAEPTMVGHYFDKPIDYSNAFIRFRYFGASTPGTPPQDLVKTPGLKFGRQYDFFFAALTNTGVPPASIADTSAGWRLAAKIPDGKQPAGGTVSAAYQRKIPVGPLRLAAPTSGTAPAPLNTADYPLIPTNVSPRGREYESFAPAQGDFALSCLSKDASVVLLSPGDWAKSGGRTTFLFDVRPPSVSWNCWDRWVSGDSTVPIEDRWNLIAEIYRNTAARGNTIAAPDMQPDDPAVENKLWIELRQIADDGTLVPPSLVGGQIDPKWSTWSNAFAPPNPGTGDQKSYLKAYQRGPIHFTCAISGTDEGISVSNAGVQISVKQGGLYRLAICAAVKVDTPPAPQVSRFASILGSPSALPGGSYFVVSPSYFTLEGATALKPTTDQLWAASRCVFQAQPAASTAPATGRIRVELDPFRPWDGKKHSATDPDVSPFRYVYRANVLHQAWRWTGRPPHVHPELDASGAAPDSQNEGKWEAREFGERLDAENIEHVMAVVRVPDAKQRTQDPLHNMSDIRNYRFDIVPTDENGRYDERGQHHRFWIQAYSRYEGLMPNAAMAVQWGTDKDAFGNPWMRLFVASQRQDALPPPKIRLILPLTQSEPEDSLGPAAARENASLKSFNSAQMKAHSAGLLVVLSEPWYELGGIGEGFEARVEMAPSPYQGPSDLPKQYFYQIGPDATVNIQKLTSKLFKDPVLASDKGVTFDGIVGPVGHYFDADNNSALFVGTSFMLSPPSLPTGKDGAMDWYFARLSLRRTLDSRFPPVGNAVQEYSSPNGANQPSATTTWKLQHSYSAYTEPVWVQFLPEFSVYDNFNSFGGHVSALRLGVDFANKKLQLQGSDGKAVTFTQTVTNDNTSGKAEYTLYLVLTRMVVDIIGRPDQESYVGLFHQADQGTWIIDPNDTFPTDAKAHYRARIIEVQRPIIGPSGGDQSCWNRPANITLWHELFNVSIGGCDTLARIVRVSEPVDDRASQDACGG